MEKISTPGSEVRLLTLKATGRTNGPLWLGPQKPALLEKEDVTP